jgi:heme-degrading monooxygenase HmoA
MHARMMTYQVQQGRIDEYIKHSREQTRPAARRRKGWRGVVVLVDPQTHRTHAISLWDTEADMKAALDDSSFFGTLPGHTHAVDGFTTESYEVADFELKQ